MFNCTIFSTANSTYLFDGVSGNILSIDAEKVDIIEQLFSFQNTGQAFLNKHMTDPEIDQAINSGLILPMPHADFSYWFDESVYYKTIFDEMSHLMISVTDSCNMRCKYCVYGGHYQNERTHGENRIDVNSITKIIDRFYKLSKCNSKIINFYGGEPFICFPEIKASVAHINNHSENIQIYITTNGTLLNDDVCQWFSENPNIHIYVSIAGIPTTHDELRIFANGQPTFELISKNLKVLRGYNPSAYVDRVHFVFNLFDERQLIELQSFWNNHEIFSGITNLPEITFIDCVDDDGAIATLGEEVSNKYTNVRSPLDEYIRLLQLGEFENLVVKHYDNKFLRIHRRACDSTPIISGVCRPFVKKLFVDMFGNLHLCENFTFGNNFKSIFDDFPIAQTKELLSSYKSFRQDKCSLCWAYKMCSLCFRDVFDRDGTINPLRSEKMCIAERKTLEKSLSEYCTVLEKSSTLLDHLNNYTIYV